MGIPHSTGFLATDKILKSEIAYEHWRALAVDHENATLWPFCSLQSGLFNVKISRTFIEGLLADIFPDVVMLKGMY